MVSTALKGYSLHFFEKKRVTIKEKWNNVVISFFNNTKYHKNVTKSQQKIENLVQSNHYYNPGQNIWDKL